MKLPRLPVGLLPPPLVFWRPSGAAFRFGQSVFDTLVSTPPSTTTTATTTTSSSTSSAYDDSKELRVVPTTPPPPLRPWTGDHCEHYDRLQVALWQDEYTLSLEAQPSTRIGTHPASPPPDAILPLGRARYAPRLDSTPCPTTLPTTRHATHRHQQERARDLQQQHQELQLRLLLDNRDEPNPPSSPTTLMRRWRPYCELAVIGLILDSQQEHILMTRRPSYMRSFPHAWVLPGGAVDALESLPEAISREVFEETGLTTTSKEWELESMWESVYPTTLSDQQQQQQQQPIRRHHLVVVTSTILSSSSSLEGLTLCPDEVDGAVWLSYDHVKEILQRTNAGTAANDSKNKKLPPSPLLPLLSPPSTTETGDDTPETSSSNKTIPLTDLVGIYPQELLPTNGAAIGGLGQGTLFALEEFFVKWTKRRRRKK